LQNRFRVQNEKNLEAKTEEDSWKYLFTIIKRQRHAEAVFDDYDVRKGQEKV
jgi:hypothetical protein